MVDQRTADLTALSGPLGRRIAETRDRVVEAAAQYGVSNLGVFGSVARGHDGETSDVDLLVDLPARIGLFGLARLEAELESIIGAPRRDRPSRRSPAAGAQ
jgi:predicted nucleotidyltransferase